MSLGFGGAVVIPRRGATESAESYIDRLIPVLEGALTPNTGAAPTLYDNQGRIVVGPGGVYAYSSTGGLAVAPNVVTIDTQDIVDAAINTQKIIQATGIETVTIVSGGTGYAVGDAVTFTETGGTGATGVVSAVSSTGVITAVAITNQGEGYSNAVTVGVTSSGGSGASLTASTKSFLALDEAIIGTAQIGDGVIVTAKIGDAQIVNASIADLAVNDAKIANASVSKLTAGTILADGIFVGGEQIELDGTATQISVSDDQTVPQNRVTIGRLGAGDSNYGIQIRDASGNLILSSGSSANISGTFVTNLNASNINTGTLNAARIGAGTIDATKLNVATLSAITANLGTVNAGTINGVNINGSRYENITSSDPNPMYLEVSGSNSRCIEVWAYGPTNSRGLVAYAVNPNGIGVTAQASGSAGIGVEARAAGGGARALVVTGTSAITSNIAQVTAESTSYNAPALRVDVARAANSAFSYFVGRASGGSDVAVRLSGDGSGYCDGSWTGGGADYAEYFESLTGLSIPVGDPVVLDGDKVRSATGADDPADIMGVVRPKGASVVIGNAAWNRWHGKYLRDDYGAPVMEEYTVYRWGPDDDHHESENAEDAPEGAEAVVQQRRKLNPDYDPNAAYTPRSERPEWCVIGLMGQIAITKGRPVNPNWRKMKDISPTVELWLVR